MHPFIAASFTPTNALRISRGTVYTLSTRQFAHDDLHPQFFASTLSLSSFLPPIHNKKYGSRRPSAGADSRRNSSVQDKNLLSVSR